MKLFKLLLAMLALCTPTLAMAQNGASNSPRVQGAPDGFGDPVQVTIVGSDGTGAGVTGGATYAAQFSAYAAYATPTDLFCIHGSATKTVAVLNLYVAIQSTAAALQTVDIVKRSTATTGGTPTDRPFIAYDSAQTAATATATTYGAAPTTGSVVGIVKTSIATSSTLTTGPTPLGLNWTNYNVPSPINSTEIRRPVTLRGVAQALCINYRGAALTAGFAASGFAEVVEY